MLPGNPAKITCKLAPQVGVDAGVLGQRGQRAGVELVGQHVHLRNILGVFQQITNYNYKSDAMMMIETGTRVNYFSLDVHLHKHQHQNVHHDLRIEFRACEKKHDEHS